MKKKLFLSGDYTYPLYHPLKNVDSEIFAILGDDFEFALNTEHFESLEDYEYARFDTVLLYNDHWIDKSPTVHQQVQALLHYVLNGGGLLVVHNLDPGVDYEMAQMLGGALKKTLAPQNHRHIDYFPAAVDHPILQGVGPFSLEDDLFDIHHDRLTDKTVLLNARIEEGIEVPMAWAIEFGLGRVVYIAPGHDVTAFRNPEYRKLLRNAALWTAGGLAGPGKDTSL
ncbi:MAG: ThuA domain-containing protein [Firmicutes bacterium]|nr:ThuA domain-containing protein [Bacillota bacterium]